MKNWTKTKAALPKEGKNVLCFSKHEGKFIAHLHDGKWRHWGRDGFDSPGWEYHSNVTDWMDLPDDPS